MQAKIIRSNVAHSFNLTKCFLPHRKDEILFLANFEENKMQFIAYEDYKNERVTARHSMIQSDTYFHENHRSLNI